MTSDIGIAAIDPATGDVETLIQPKSLFPYFTIDQDGTLYLARNLDNSRESENQGAQLLAYDLNDLQAEPRTVYERLGEGCVLDYPNLCDGGCWKARGWAAQCARAANRPRWCPCWA